MMKHYSLFDVTTGAFIGREFVGTTAALVINIPPGCAAVEGAHDHLSQRVDFATGQVVDWQPPQPPDDELRTWHWRTGPLGQSQWVPRLTDLARTQQAQALVQQRMDALERTQGRAMRELAITPGRSDARAALAAIEARMTALRAEFAAPALLPLEPLPPEPTPRAPMPAVVFVPPVPAPALPVTPTTPTTPPPVPVQPTP